LGKQSSRKLVADDRGYRLIRNVLERNWTYPSDPLAHFHVFLS
jgi:hypothetical protein